MPPLSLSDDGLMALIPLRAIDRKTVRAYAIIDAADAEWANQWRWCLDHDGYVIRVGKTPDGSRITSFKLHRELLGLVPDDGLEGDHINRIKLDNRRENLRPVPDGKNVQNQGSQPGSSSYRGVTWSKQHRKWQAQTFAAGKYRYLGYFDREEDAAEAARAGRARLLPYATD